MKISKHLHSCLVYKHDSFKHLFDPGTPSFVNGIVTPDMFKVVAKNSI